MKIKFIINLPGLKFWGKSETSAKKPASRKTSFWKRIAEYKDVFKLLLAAGLAFYAGSHFEASTWEIMILGYFLFVLLKKFDSRLSAGLALACLAFTPISLYWIDESFAETLAVYAFYFLCITVIQELKELGSGALSKKAERFRELKNKIKLSPVSRKVNTFGAALKADFFGSAQAIGQYWIVFLMLLTVYAAMIFFFKFETNRLAFYALAVFSAISAFTRLRQWRKRKTTA